MATGAQGIRAGRAYVELGTNADKLNKGLASAQARVQAFASATRSALVSTFAISAPAALAVKSFAAFDDQMRLVQAVTGATGQQFAALTERAKELGRTTSWTAAQVAQGMTSLGRAGFQTEEIQSSVSSVMDLARATGTEIETATDIAGNALRAFGLDATQMARVCDVLTATANGSAQTLEDLGEAFKYVAPIAASTGHTIEDSAKIVGALANFGVKGSQAGTVLKAIQTRLASDKNAQATYAKLGIDTTDAQGNLRKVNDVLIDLGKTLQSMPSADRLATIKTLFGQYGLSGVALTTANFQELNDAIDRAGGTAQRVAQTMDDGLGGAVRITKSAVEGFALAVGESLVPTLTSFAKSVQSAAASLTSWTQANPAAIQSTASLVVKFGAASAVLYAVSKACSVALSGVKLLTSSYNALVRSVDFFVGASRAADAVQKARAATDAALANVANKVQAVNAATSATARAAAQAELALATAEYKTAAAAQAAAVAKARARAATVAMTAASIAAVAVVGGLTLAYLNWAGAADRAATASRNASDAADAAAVANEQRRADDRELFAELQKLASQQELTSNEFARAQYVVKELTDRYGDLGIKCDDAAKAILGMAGAQDAFNEAQKKQEIQDAKNQIETYNDEIERNNAAIRNQDSFLGGVGAAIRSGFSSSAMLQRRQELVDRNRELERLIRSEQNKLELARNTEPATATVQNNQTVEPVPAIQGPQVPPTVVEPPEIAPIVVPSSEPVEIVQEQNDATASAIDRALARLDTFDSFAAGIAAQVEQVNAEKYDFEAPTVLFEPFAEEIANAVDSLGDLGTTIGQSFESSGTFNAFESMEIDGSAQLAESRRQTRVLEDVRAELKRQNELEEGDLI